MSRNSQSQGWSNPSNDFWCEENNNSQITQPNTDYEFFFEDAFSVETEEDLPDEFFDLPPSPRSFPPTWTKVGSDFSTSSSMIPSPYACVPVTEQSTTTAPLTYAPITGNYGTNTLPVESRGDTYSSLTPNSDPLIPQSIKSELFVTDDYLTITHPSFPTTSTPVVATDVIVKPDPVPEIISIKPDPYEKPLYPSDDLKLENEEEPETEDEESKKKPKKKSFPRKQFRETIGTEIYRDLMSEQYSYDEIIMKYSKLYPQHAARFTPSFCSKVRCGRIMNVEPNKNKGICKSRVKRVSKLSQRKMWRKMTPELFGEISSWEKNQNRQVKQSELEQIFNVNRSTYYRWKKLQNKNSATQRESKTFGN